MGAAPFQEWQYYKHSGKFTVHGVIIAMLLALLVSMPVAFLYAWIIRLDPLVFINVIVNMATGPFIGWATGSFLNRNKCRNIGVAIIITMLVTSAFLYISWAVWLHAVIGEIGVMPLIFNPARMWSLIQEVADKGAWSMKDHVINGTMLQAMWAAEALSLFMLSVIVASSVMGRTTFCETCDRVTDRIKGIVYAAAGQSPNAVDKNALTQYVRGLRGRSEGVRSAMESRNYQFIRELGPVPEDAFAWYRMDLNTCAACGNTNTLSVAQVQWRTEKNEVRPGTEEKHVMDQLVLSAVDAQALMNLGKELRPLLPVLNAEIYANRR